MHYSDKIISAGSAFTLGQAPSFGSQDYVVDRSGELRLFKGDPLKDDESPMLFPPTGLLHVDLEVLSH